MEVPIARELGYFPSSFSYLITPLTPYRQSSITPDLFLLPATVPLLEGRGVASGLHLWRQS